MPRIRNIKPEFWSDERITDLDSPWDRLLFIGLWNFVDDHGYTRYSPRRIKMQVFPGDDVDVTAGLARLLAARLIDAYEVADDHEDAGDVVLHVRHWARHQRVSHPAPNRYEASDLRRVDRLPGHSGGFRSPRESSGVLANPPEEGHPSEGGQAPDLGIRESSGTFANPREDSGVLANVPGGREGEGRGRDEGGEGSLSVPPRKTSTSTRGTRLPDGWRPSDDVIAAMTIECPGFDLRAEHRVFTDYWRAQPGQRGVKVDWPATWRNWMRRAYSDQRRPTGTAPRRSTTDERVAQAQSLKRGTRPTPPITEQLAIGGPE